MNIFQSRKINTVQRKSFAGKNFCELLKIEFLLLKLSRIEGNNDDTPIETFANCPITVKFAKIFTRERLLLYGSTNFNSLKN